MTAIGIIRASPTAACQPWSRHVLHPASWAQMAAALATAPALSLRALWADATHVHALLLDKTGTLLPISTPVDGGGYPALSPARPAAAWYERMVQDLWGHVAVGGRDLRPWLDHGRWPQARPLAARPGPSPGRPEPPEFLPPADERFTQAALGPIHGGIEPPAHLRVTLAGERVRRLESRLGYAHKGTLALMRGKSPRTAARFAARLAAEATVAHSIAFARAAEAASEIAVPPRATALRAVMAELERIADQLGAVGAVGEAAGAGWFGARCGLHAESARRAAAQAFGHRLMMDCVVPGGVAADIAPGGSETIVRALDPLDEFSPPRLDLRLADRLACVGTITLEQAQAFAAGGPLGRAAGQGFDARRFGGMAPYDAFALAVPVLAGGDALACLRVRLAEIAESVRLLRALLAALPEGAVSVPLPMASGEGIGWAEAPGGDVWHWLRLDHGQIATAFLRDPGWAHWPLLEAAAAGAGAEDLPLIQRSFALGSSGVDL
jgi:Ni,Fe-hydrogenase III large subunit